MSLQELSRFIDRLRDDPDLMSELESAIGELDGSAAASAVAGVAAAHGFAFTAEEAVQARNALFDDPDGELVESELEAVAGGVFGQLGREVDRSLRGANVRPFRRVGRDAEWVGRQIGRAFRGW